MNSMAVLFPGQGSQAVGMGKELFEKTEIAKKMFRQADEILGFKLSKICFEGPEDELKLTANTQPALLVVSSILYQLWQKQPAVGAGHSLGEYSAIVAAGGISFEDAVLLVHKRGKYMQEAVPVGQGTMAALIGVSYEQVREKLAELNLDVDIANWNSSNQIVISGRTSQVKEAVEKIKSLKTVYLPVSAPFHSRLMLPAEESLANDLDQVEIADLKFPVINNVEVKLVQKAEEIRSGLKRQVSRGVLWYATMMKMLKELEITKFYEIGSGRVLAGLLKRAASEQGLNVEIRNIETLQDIENDKN